MRISVPNQTSNDERRVALTPDVLAKLADLGFEASIAPGAGEASSFPNNDYASLAEVAGTGWDGDLVVQVGPPSVEDIEKLQPGTSILGFLDPFARPDLMRALADRDATAIAFEAVPRTTLAQSMDALSSQATVAGYAAVLEGARRLPRFLPMLTTAAGTIRPSRALILGVGVAGLQAIATARRLGAVVSAYDIRPATREQVESLGATFVEAPTGEADEGGYAKEADEDLQRRQLEALAEAVAGAQLVVTTAQIPGRPAPTLVTTEMVESMGPGSVIVDIAAPTGGNCELTRVGETVDHAGVTIFGPANMASAIPADASRMYARNVLSLLTHLSDGGALTLDFEDEITDGAVAIHQGDVRHPRVQELLT